MVPVQDGRRHMQQTRRFVQQGGGMFRQVRRFVNDLRQKLGLGLVQQDGKVRFLVGFVGKQQADGTVTGLWTRDAAVVSVCDLRFNAVVAFFVFLLVVVTFQDAGKLMVTEGRLQSWGKSQTSSCSCGGGGQNVCGRTGRVAGRDDATLDASGNVRIALVVVRESTKKTTRVGWEESIIVVVGTDGVVVSVGT